MACDLWGPPYNQVAEESSCMQPGWQYDFHFGYGFDVIEENALNEKFCLQVLQILISKADAEIDELENYLVSLQSELAWAEYDDWSEICCNGLRKRIDCLDVSIKALRNRDENDVEVHLLMHTQPAERAHDIVRTLFKSYRHGKDKQNDQPLDDIVLDSGSDSLGHVADYLLESQKPSVSDFNVAAEETQGPCIIHAENCASINKSSQLVEKKSNNSEIEKLDNIDAKDQIKYYLAQAAEHTDENKAANNHVLESSEKQGAREEDYSPEDKMVIQNSPSKSAGKRMLNLEIVKVESPEITMNASNMDAQEHAIGGYLNKKKKLNSSGLKITCEEVTERSSLSTEDVIILDSLSISVEERVDCSKKVKPANSISKGPVSSACKQTAGLSKEMKQLCKSGGKADGHDVQEHNVTANCKNGTSDASSIPGCNGSDSKSDKPTSAMVKNVSPDTLSCTTGFNRSRDDSDSWLGALGQEKSQKCDMDQKPCDIALKASHKRSMKEAKVSSTNKMESSSSLSEGQEKRRDHSQVVKVKKAALNNSEHSALTLLVDLQAEKEKIKTSLQLKGGEMHLDEIQMAASDENFGMNLSMVPQGKKAEMSVKSNPTNNQEFNPISKEAVSNSSLSPNARKQQKTLNSASLNCSLNGRFQNKISPLTLLEADEKGAKPDDHQSSVSPSQKKSRRASSLPMVVELRSSAFQIEFSKLHGDTIDCTGKKECSVSESYSADDCCIGLSLASVISNLKDMKLSDLRAIAKEHKLTKYHKLRKEDLVEKIVNRLGC
ncbi:hypothetical protein SLEP1_g36780 [Rubroshorea leprosula]|uniref:Rho termination factor-like N-terminal domain-containing protein n=1 Tax=Rubroshorea leprosula TaxID=152421 RepID=A0AAV5KST4_9ROSI|nr:hypothetical protein SLEP1_g36780 [Rubroshorea leprosula]